MNKKLYHPNLRKSSELPKARVFLASLVSAWLTVVLHLIWFSSESPDPIRQNTSLLGTLLVSAMIFHFRRFGDYTRCLWYLLCGAVALIIYSAWHSGGIFSIDQIWMPVLIVGAFLFGGTKLGIGITLLITSANSLFFAADLWELRSFGPDSLEPGPIYIWGILTLSFSMIALSTGYFVITMQKMQKQLLSIQEKKINELDALVKMRTQQLDQVRKEIARDFHDEMGSRLAGMALAAECLTSHTELPSDLKPELSSIAEQARNVYANTRDFVWSIDPQSDSVEEVYLRILNFGQQLFSPLGITFLQDQGLPHSLAMQCLEPGGGRHLSLALQELLTNTAKHAGAKKAWLHFTEMNHQLCIGIANDGTPFEFSQKSRGLDNIRKRVSILKGHIGYLEEENRIYIMATIPMGKST